MAALANYYCEEETEGVVTCATFPLGGCISNHCTAPLVLWELLSHSPGPRKALSHAPLVSICRTDVCPLCPNAWAGEEQRRTAAEVQASRQL